MTMDMEDVSNSLYAPSCSSNRGYPSKTFGLKGDYEAVGNRTFGAEKALKRTFNNEERSEKTRATRKREGGDNTTINPRFEREQEDNESHIISRRDIERYPGTSNFGIPESMNSTL